MNLLLDTHVALWAIADSPKLPEHARARIQNPKVVVWVSSASVWEIAIKYTLGRGDMPVSAADALAYFRASGYRLLPIEAEHTVALAELPAHHHDPFDRLLIAQALSEPLRLMTHDATVARYNSTIIQI